MDKKLVILIIIIAALLCLSCFFAGRTLSDRHRVDTGSELYQNTLAEIGKLRTEIEGYTELIEQLSPELSELSGRIESSRIGIEESRLRIESSLRISRDIESNSGKIGDLAGELNSDITDIGAASRGLAEIFGVPAN